MASNISQNIVPSLWSSANDNVEFEFSFNPYLITDTTSTSGKVRITLFSVFDVTPIVGEYIYINSNLYTGTYKILTVVSNAIVVIDLDYTGAITVDTYYCYHLRVPVFTFYKGFKLGETISSFSDSLPYTKVIDIKPSVLYSTTTRIPYLSINLKGSVNYIFDIIPNTEANSYDFSMFQGVRLTWDGLTTTQNTINGYQFFNVLNCAISNEDLNYYYIAGGIYLTPNNKPLIATQGTCFYSMLDNDYPVVHKFVNGIKQ